MPIEVTPRAVSVLRRALEAGRMNPETVGIRIELGPGGRPEDARTGFADEASAEERLVRIDGIMLFVPLALDDRGAVVDVADEHDRIVVRHFAG